jgi:hypothetical protein
MQQADDHPTDCLSNFLRPGVAMPDCSAVTSVVARNALDAAFRVAERHRKWVGLGDEEDAVRRAVLYEFASSGRAPDIANLASARGYSLVDVTAALRQLRERDLVVLANDGLTITAAYPFCDWSTGHRIRWGGTVVNALCAIDALGIGAMLGRDTEITSECRHCGVPIEIRTRDSGKAIAKASPAKAVVWAGMVYAGNCGATSGCTLKIFFCSDRHLRTWREGAGHEFPGFRLSLSEAHQVGQAMFAPMLREPGVAGNGSRRHSKVGRN